MDRQPENDRIYFNLGMLSMDDGYTNKAESWFKKAIELRPDFRSALFNLALLLERSTRPLEALPYLDSLLKYFPEHIKGLVLLGDIYTNHVKDLEKAEKAYRRILEIDPKHVQGYHQVLYHQQLVKPEGLSELGDRLLVSFHFGSSSINSLALLLNMEPGRRERLPSIGIIIKRSTSKLYPSADIFNRQSQNCQ